MPRNYAPKKKLYTEVSIASAIKEVNEGASIRKACKKYHMSRTLLNSRLKEEEGTFQRKKQVCIVIILKKWM